MVENVGEVKYELEGGVWGGRTGRGSKVSRKGCFSDSPVSIWRRGGTHRRRLLQGGSLKHIVLGLV